MSDYAGLNFIELVQNGSTQNRIEIVPDQPTEDFIRLNTTVEIVDQNAIRMIFPDWYFWDVVTVIDLYDKTRVILRVP